MLKFTFRSMLHWYSKVFREYLNVYVFLSWASIHHISKSPDQNFMKWDYYIMSYCISIFYTLIQSVYDFVVSQKHGFCHYTVWGAGVSLWWPFLTVFLVSSWVSLLIKCILCPCLLNVPGEGCYILQRRSVVRLYRICVNKKLSSR